MHFFYKSIVFIKLYPNFPAFSTMNSANTHLSDYRTGSFGRRKLEFIISTILNQSYIKNMAPTSFLIFLANCIKRKTDFLTRVQT